MTSTSYVKNYNFLPDGYPLSGDLSGRAVRLNYCSGHTLEQHWQTENRVLWKGVNGDLEGYVQVDCYRAFKLADGLYLISWVEDSTQSTAASAQSIGPWLTDVILDFNTMQATASWMGPTVDGGAEHVLDQAEMTFVDCEPNPIG